MTQSLSAPLAMAIGLGLVLGVSGTASAQSADLVAAARKEGSVTAYMAPGYKATLEEALAVWDKRYPEIKVNILEGVGTALRERIRSEHVSGKVVGDILAAPDAAIYTIAGDDNLDSVDKAKLPAAEAIIAPLRAYEDAKSRYFPVSVAVFGINVNTSKMKLADAPKSWHDLAEPRYQGKLGVLDFSILGPGSVLMAIASDQLGKPFFETLLRDRKPPTYDSLSTLNAVVASGERAVVAPARSVDGYGLNGSPVQWVVPEEGVLLSNNYVGMLKNAPHPNAAVLFMNFLMGPEAQKGYVAAGAAAVVPGIPGGVDLNKVKILAGLKSDDIPKVVKAMAEARALEGH